MKYAAAALLCFSWSHVLLRCRLLVIHGKVKKRSTVEPDTSCTGMGLSTYTYYKGVRVMKVSPIINYILVFFGPSEPPINPIQTGGPSGICLQRLTKRSAWLQVIKDAVGIQPTPYFKIPLPTNIRVSPCLTLVIVRDKSVKSRQDGFLS